MNRAPVDLREFLARLESLRELHRIRAVADPHLEIAAITDRVCKGAGGGPALRFEHPAGFQVPVLTNLFGTPRRMALALGGENLETPAGRFAKLLGGVAGASGMARLATLLGQSRWQPVPVSGSTGWVELPEPKLEMLPALHSWPGDGGRYLTLPLVFTADPETGTSNCGMYRLQLYPDGRLGLHLGPGADAGRHLRAWHARGRAMPVAVALGGPPALIFAAGLPLPPGLAETALAGLLLGTPLSVDSCRGSDLQVPATAEFVLEGEIRPGETRPEGPFGNHTGHYVPAAPAPLVRITAMRHRPAPLYPATVVGPPPMEDCWLAKAAERLLLPLLQLDVPEVVDWNLPLATIFHGAVLVSARVSPGAGQVFLQHLRQHPLLTRSRLLVLFDQRVDVQDASGCYWRAMNRMVADRDLVLAGEALSIDATGEGRAEVGPTAHTLHILADRWPEYGLDGD